MRFLEFDDENAKVIKEQLKTVAKRYQRRAKAGPQEAVQFTDGPSGPDVEHYTVDPAPYNNAMAKIFFDLAKQI